MSTNKTGLTRTFNINQLVAVRSAEFVAKLDTMTTEQIEAGQAEGIGRIGRVTFVDGDNVTLKSADETIHVLSATKLIPAVHYDVLKPIDGKVGERAAVVAIDHPILGGQPVYTSEIQFILPNGMFETSNSLYMPNKVDMLGLGIEELLFDSPYLDGTA